MPEPQCHGQVLGYPEVLLETVLLIAISFGAGIAISGLLFLLVRRNQPDLERVESALHQSLHEMRLELQDLTQRERQEGLGHLYQVVKPLESTLSRFQNQIQELEKGREKGLGSIRQYLDEAIRGQAELRYQTHRLVSSLQSSNARGRWGEISLKRAVELAGMVEHCDFQEQPQLPGSKLRPDLLVHLPNDRLIVVDAKVPMKAFLAAMECEEEQETERLLSDHSRQILRHVESLASREYWSHLERSPEFVVLFLPLESLLSSALRVRRELLDEAIGKGVMPATPVTLIALLRAVEYGWKQDTLSRNASRICDCAREIHSQVARLARHLTEVGRHLDQAVAAHNRTVSNIERNLLDPVRRLSELGVPTQDSIPEPDPITRRSRPGVGAED